MNLCSLPLDNDLASKVVALVKAMLTFNNHMLNIEFWHNKMEA